LTQSSDYIHDPACRICGVLYTKHPRCSCCGIYCGPRHFKEMASIYRGKALCDSCIESWINFEKKSGDFVAWDVFVRSVTLPKRKARGKKADRENSPG